VSNPVLDDFVFRAKAVSVTDAALRLDVPFPKRRNDWSGDTGQPCPRCFGNDRFSINGSKQVWNCRNCEIGGRDGISLAAFLLHHDTKLRSGFLGACAAVLGEEIPAGGERETDDERAERERRRDESERKLQKERADRDRQQNDFREREIKKARGIYFNAQECADETTDGARYIRTYLRRRTGYIVPMETFFNLRFDGRHSYWDGNDEFGRPLSIHSGPAMIAPFVTLDGQVTGCHETWIDLRNGPKFRPDLGHDAKGDRLTTKKMRGIKKGSLVPILGEMTSRRWMGGEGIETVLAVAGFEGFRTDTFYFAAGDLGNLSGPADRGKGRSESYQIGGRKVSFWPHPKPDQSKDEAIQLPQHVSALVLLADGDSEFYFTAAAMARAKARLSAQGRDIHIWWPPQGADFASLLCERA
jgi:hypothetical protein